MFALLVRGLLAALLLPIVLASARAQTDTTRPNPTVPITTVPRAPLSPLEDEFPYGAYRHSIEFDTLTGDVRLREELFGTPFGQPRTLTMEEYIRRRQEEQQRAMWEERARQYKLTKPDEPDSTASLTAASLLDSLLKGGPSIKIPLPKAFAGLFGDPSVNIDVKGSVTLSAGWQVDNNNLTSISSYGSSQSAPFFDQNIQVAVTGKVGTKLKLSSDFDTQRSYDLDNQLKITFGGGPESDDDIIQGVEAGNVALQTPSTLIGGSQTLFGLKTKMKFGKLLLTNILSQKRGERRVVKVSGGSTQNQITLKPYEYAQNHFWLDTVYKSFYDEYYRNTPPSATPRMAPYKVTDIEVYEQVQDGAAPSQFDAIAYADLAPIQAGNRYDDNLRQPPSSTGGLVQRGSFIRLEKGRGYDVNEQLGIVTIRSLQRDKLYAVAYRTSDGKAYGELSNTRPDSNTVAILKLIYVNNLQPSFTTLWARQMKNIYQLQGVRNVDLENSIIRVTYGVPPDTSEIFRVEGGKRIVTVLGVDRTNTSNQAIPDGVFDIKTPAFFDPTTGEIIFPSTEPFRKKLREELGPSAEPFVLDAIYDQTRDEAQRDTRVGKYTIGGDIAGTGGNKIALNTFNLAPNSVRVLKNGEALVEGVDYRLDPIVGQVTLVSPRANSGGDIEVEFEQNDLFTTSVKTLVGLRADYDLYNKRRVKSKIGMTLMRYGQSLPIDKIQIYSGEEPVLNTGIGFDGFVNYNAPFLTKMIDALPFIETKAPSELNFSGEWAAMLPGAGTLNDLIDIDKGESVAYIDDFESGAKRQIQLGINYTLWHHSSPPVDDDLGFNDTDRIRNKGLFWWYNRTPANTSTTDIWPDRDVQNTASTTTVLDILLEPNERGIYNPNTGYETNPPLPQAWGSMMRSLSFFTTNLNEENIDFVELTLSADEFGPDTKLYLELGQISEDVIPNVDLNTEDGVTAANPQRDDVLNQGEDIGIDGEDDEQERGTYGVNEPDPARDDYFFTAYRSDNPDDYKKVNGLEANVGQERGPFPDSEDLNGNRSVDLDNSYFRYTIDLNTEPTTNPQIVGSGKGLWRQYRIPLRTGYQSVGSPSFANVQYARLVVKSPTKTHVRIAEMNLVGSDWRNMDLAIGDTAVDPKLDISFVNLEDNGGAPDFYRSPEGVSQQISQFSGLRDNEQSLALTVQDLQRGESRGAIRVRPRAFDVFNYKKMRFYMHGAGDMDEAVVEGQQPKVMGCVRFGWDSLNYYEYRFPLLRDWHPYEIDFNELAAIKFDGNTEVPVPGKPGHVYAVRGQPSLTRIQFIAFCVRNNAWPGALNTTVWVNELRAVEAQGGADWAATITASAKLADFATINYNANKFNPNFHRLEERFGDRVERVRWAFNSVFQMDKFLPAFMKGSTIPFTYNHLETIEHPLYVAESDVGVEAARQRLLGDTQTPGDNVHQADSLKRATETLVVQDALAFNDFKLQFSGNNWIVKDIINNLKFGFTYDQRRERSPLLEQRFQWQWDFQGGYAVNLPRNFTIRPFKSLLDSIPVLDFWEGFEITYLPTQLGTSVTLHRERTTEKLRELPDPSPVIRDFRATRVANFTWPIIKGGIINPQIDYNLAMKSTLADLEIDSLGRQRSGSEIFGDLFLNEGRLLNFGQDYNMVQTFTFNSRPRIPFIPNADRFVTPTAQYKVDYTWDDKLGPRIGEGSFTKSAQYNARSTLGLTIRLKQIGDVIFGDQPTGGPRRATDSAESSGAVGSILRALIKVPLLDWDQFQLNFTQNNTAKNDGVVGGGGLSNLWGRSLLFRSESPDFGPGMAYQLGLIRYPHGTLSFPWFGSDVDRGVRAPGIYVQDNYSQDNNLTANTSRQLLPGMTLTLNWNARWGINQNYSVISDANGLTTYQDYTTTENLSRTYLSLPIFFDNDIEGVVNEYGRRKGEIPTPVDPGAGATQAEKDDYSRALTAYNTIITRVLSETFEQQLEALNWLPSGVKSFFPRANWRIQWNGLEKLPFLSAWTQRASLTHEYRGQFTRNFRETTDGLIPETQTVSRGFQPLIGLTLTGKPEFWKGTASASLNYNTSSDFALVAAARSEISKQLRNEMQLRLSYQRRGLKLSIFGLDLKNEIEFTTDFSFSRQNTKRFNLTDFRPEGNNDGSTRISFRPAIRYTISRTVDATGFVSYEATIPDGEGSRDISRSTLKVGVDLRLKVSGGR